MRATTLIVTVLVFGLVGCGEVVDNDLDIVIDVDSHADADVSDDVPDAPDADVDEADVPESDDVPDGVATDAEPEVEDDAGAEDAVPDVEDIQDEVEVDTEAEDSPDVPDEGPEDAYEAEDVIEPDDGAPDLPDVAEDFAPDEATEDVGVEDTAPEDTYEAEAEAEAEAEVDTGPTCPIGSVLVPAGTFEMGCEATDYPCYEYPPRTVYLSAYCIDETEVANRWYRECVVAGVCPAPRPADNMLPVQVVLAAAETFCSWAGGSLPTEAQWEKAARGSSDMRHYPWGDTVPDCSYGCNYYCCGEAEEVGSYSRNASPYGALDMTSNVKEWTTDSWRDTLPACSAGGCVDPAPYWNAASTSHVARGGFTVTSFEYARVTQRLMINRTSVDTPAGIRCVYPTE